MHSDRFEEVIHFIWTLKRGSAFWDTHPGMNATHSSAHFRGTAAVPAPGQKLFQIVNREAARHVLSKN